MPLILWNNKLLLVGGKLALNTHCCCDPGTPPIEIGFSCSLCTADTPKYVTATLPPLDGSGALCGICDLLSAAKIRLEQVAEATCRWTWEISYDGCSAQAVFELKLVGSDVEGDFHILINTASANNYQLGMRKIMGASPINCLAFVLNLNSDDDTYISNSGLFACAPAGFPQLVDVVPGDTGGIHSD